MQTMEFQTEKVTADLEDLFHQAMLAQIAESVDMDPFAVFVLQRVKRDKGMQTAKRMLAKRGQQTGLMRLWQEGRLDISVEALVLQEPFRNLFSQEELDTARQRLIALGYPVD